MTQHVVTTNPTNSVNGLIVLSESKLYNHENISLGAITWTKNEYQIPHDDSITNM